MFSASSAITYNNGRNFSQKAIGIIQSVVKAPTIGKWDAQSVTAVNSFQTQRAPKLSADGKVGPSTLGAVIGELQYAYRKADADVLRSYPHVLPGTIDSKVTRFDRTPRSDLHFERYTQAGKPRWRASCQFDMSIEIDPSIGADVANIEYRQFIKGGIWVREGDEDWKVAPNGNIALPIPAYAGTSANNELPKPAVPGVGLSSAWKEDGQQKGSNPNLYGYRKTATTNLSREKDFWAPNYYGHNYQLRDTPSISGWWNNKPIEVWIELYFMGCVVEVQRHPVTDATTVSRVIKSKTWQYQWLGKKLENYNATMLGENW